MWGRPFFGEVGWDGILCLKRLHVWLVPGAFAAAGLLAGLGTIDHRLGLRD
ncbi:MAG: hypothetical protein HKN01_10160 [Acidimicrobiia bacterium]|nr:hypothetical protein [Acidimicrobiia bacterium]